MRHTGLRVSRTQITSSLGNTILTPREKIRHAQLSKIQKYQVVGLPSDDALDLRNGPDTSANLIAKLPLGFKGIIAKSTKRVGDNPRDQWVHVKIPDGRSGWVARKFLAGQN